MKLGKLAMSSAASVSICTEYIIVIAIIYMQIFIV